MTDMEREDAETPLWRFLSREHPKEVKAMLRYFQFVASKEGEFHYRNNITRSILVVDGSGKLVSCGKDALHTISTYVAVYPKRKYRRKTLRA